MPTFKQQIEQIVDEGIKAGRISAQMRQSYIDQMAANEQTAEFWAGNIMRAADYTNKNKERVEMERQVQARVDAERAALASQRQQLETWKLQAEAELNRLRQYEGESARWQSEKARYDQVLRDYNLADQIPAGQSTTTPAPSPTAYPPSHMNNPSQQPAQNPQWVSQQDAIGALNGVLDVQGELAVIMAEHQFLYGQPLRDNLIQEARNAGQLQNIRSYWENKYNVPGKRAELDERNRLDNEARIRAEEREKVLAELAADPSRVVQPGGAIWQPEQSPLATHYMASRAAAHNPVSPEARQAGAPAGQTERRLPEQINYVQSRRDSVEAAAKYFNSRFNPDGTPINRGGGPAS